MPRPTLLFVVALVLAACSTAPVSRSGPRGSSTDAALTADRPASVDAAAEFLIAAVATDFHAHRPSDRVRFREVRLGHVPAPGGEVQYMLCGEYRSALEGDEGWTPFATIQTSGYEQWNGAQAAGLCQRLEVIWDDTGDLSSALQRRLDSLRDG